MLVILLSDKYKTFTDLKFIPYNNFIPSSSLFLQFKKISPQVSISCSVSSSLFFLFK